MIQQTDEHGNFVEWDDEPVNKLALCKKRGGGGHRGAAGFQCKELPFKLRSSR